MAKMIHGDCFDEFQKIQDNAFNVVLTSPPYNRKRDDKYDHHRDVSDDYFLFLKRSINECLRVCNGNVFFNVQKNSYNRSDVHKVMGEFADKIIEVIVWHKSNPMPNPHLINAYEYVLVLSKTNKSLKANKTYTMNHFTTPVYSSNPYKKIHRAVMHPQACIFILQNFCSQGDCVFDPFAGTGTTGTEAIRMGMDFYGVELNEEYFNIAKRRIEDAETIARQSLIR